MEGWKELNKRLGEIDLKEQLSENMEEAKYMRVKGELSENEYIMRISVIQGEYSSQINSLLKI